MQTRPLILSAALLALGATPALALTVQSAPPKPEIAQRLTPVRAAVVRPEDTFAGAGGRPEPGRTATPVRDPVVVGFGPVRMSLTADPADGYFHDNRPAAGGPELPIVHRR